MTFSPLPCTMYRGVLSPKGLMGTRAFHFWLTSLDSKSVENCLMVGYSKRIDSDNLTPDALSILVITSTAINECPPISKKSSSRPMLSTPKDWLQIRATSSSFGEKDVWSWTVLLSVGVSGLGNDLRSILLFDVKGKRSNIAQSLGII